MTRICPLIGAGNFSLHPTNQIQPNELGGATASSLVSLNSKKCVGSLVSLIAWPFTLVGRVLRGVYHFFCRWVCCCGGKQSIDWKGAEEVFVEINRVVRLSNENSTDRQKTFNRLIAQLDYDHSPAMDRFKEHIGFAIAKQQGNRKRADQEKWNSENLHTINFKELLDDVDNSCMQEAVRGFYEEIILKLPPKTVST